MDKTVLAVLLINSILDWKYKKISLISILMAIIYALITRQIELESLHGITVGFLLILCSFFTKGQIGMGDGIIFCLTGLECGFWKNISLLFVSLLFSAIVSAILLLSKKAGRKTRIPLVPFIMASYIFVRFCNI